MRKFIASLLLLSALVPQTLSAAVRLPKVISECMVLQRGTPLKIWGWADPAENVTVRFRGDHFYTQADADGNWSVTLPSQTAGGPFLLEVNDIVIRDVLVGDVWLCSGQSNQETPIERLVIRYPEIAVSNNHMIRLYKVPTQDSPGKLCDDIPGGERWHSAIASDVMNWRAALAYMYAQEAYERTGIPQGMMVSSLGGSAIQSWVPEEYLMKFPDIAARKKAADEAAAAAPAGDMGAGKWSKEKVDVSSWKDIELPAFFADRGLKPATYWFRKDFNLPSSMVGRHAKLSMGRLVDADSVFVNGVCVGTTSYFGPPRVYSVPSGLLHEGVNNITVRLQANGADAGFVPDKPYVLAGDDDEVQLSGTWKYEVGMERQMGAVQGGMRMGMGRPGGVRFTGAGLFNGMIWPIRDYSYAGAIWYQGESDTNIADQYDELLESLIESWREVCNDPDLPFLIAQLPNYMEKYDHPTESDWAEMREAQLKATLAAPNTSMATSYDIGEWNDIHPLNKKDLAKRLYLGARKIVFGEKIQAMGPVYKDYKVSGNKVIISFTEVGGGLKSYDGKPLQHFAIAGADRKFVWADAVIKGNQVIVSSPEVPEPVAVRYAWANNPDNANLCNKEGLLASPFRTDDWNLRTGPHDN